MLTGKKRVDFTNMFSPYDFEKNDSVFWVILKVNEIDKKYLTDQTKFRLNEISRIENYLTQKLTK